MKCIDCKFCAFINEGEKQMIVKSNGVEIPYQPIKGSYCMRLALNVFDVEECSGYEKSNRKKLIPFK